MRRWWSDARHFQIVALSSLLLVNFTWIDFGAKPLYSALAILSALATQAVCSRLAGLPNIDLRSPLITGLSLSLLLRADAAWLPALAGVIAIASKFVFRLDGKHIWNPAGFAIVVLLFTQHGVWISPGPMGHQRLARGAVGVFRDPGAAGRAALRHRAVLPRQPCRAARCPRRLARRSAGHSAASIAERVAADLRLLHDLRSANGAGFAPRPLAVCLGAWRRWRTISRSSCKCGRRSMWR